MKRIFTLSFLILIFSLQSNAQPLLQASIGIGSTPSRIKIYIKCNQTLTTNISTLEFNVGVAESDAIPKPTVVSASDGITWVINDVFTEGGYNNFAVTSGTSPFTLSLTANTEYQVMELEFPSHTIMPNEVSLVTLPEGGSNTLLLYLATGTPSCDGSNLYYTRPGTTVDNEFSFDLNNPDHHGTTTSTATLVGVALPVKLSTFTVSPKNNDALLAWTVENQDATSSHFEIERSTNGTNFNPIGSVDATSESQASYSYTDENINLSGTVYYRIKMVDKDGQFDFSDVKSIRLNNVIFSASVYPNPVSTSSKLSVELTQAQAIKVSINDALGNLVKQIQITGQKGINEKTLDLSSIPSGSYIIRIQAGQNLKSIPIIKN